MVYNYIQCIPSHITRIYKTKRYNNNVKALIYNNIPSEVFIFVYFIDFFVKKNPPQSDVHCDNNIVRSNELFSLIQHYPGFIRCYFENIRAKA